MGPDDVAAAEYRAEVLANLEVMTAVAVLGVALVVFLLAVLTVRHL
ncbi:hypothetical protein ACXR2T_12055 [Leucobacter sp. HY1910]